MSKKAAREQILHLVRSRRLTPEQGLRLIKELQAGRIDAAAIEKLTVPAKKKELYNQKSAATDIAIIGVSGRFPGAANLDEFWLNMLNKVDAVTDLPEGHWDLRGYEGMEGHYSRRGGFLDNHAMFDASFFAVPPVEAEMMDPHQRIFLEEAYTALEDAGYSDTALSGYKCGVFVGAAQSDYIQRVSWNEKNLGVVPYAFTGFTASILASRISYFLNLKGPTITIETACSSSLVAICKACQSLLAEESDMALAGGIALTFSPFLHLMSTGMGIVSAAGVCRPFDNEADGTIISEGAGVLVLKRLQQALDDGDHIRAVIKGFGINQDGRTNGITAPSAESQTRLELDIYRKYNIDPATLQYVETHGTGTKLGDPIEIKALTKAFRTHTDKKAYCAIGSVKATIGHATLAAGVASVIKSMLCLQHKTIPPLAHYQEINSHIDLQDSPFYITTESRPWTSGEKGPRRAAVSSFGYSGTNAHIVIEEAPETVKGLNERPAYCVPLSAASENALRRKIHDLSTWLEREGEQYPMGAIAYTLSVGRSHYTYRVAFTVKNRKELSDRLREYFDNMMNTMQTARKAMRLSATGQRQFEDALSLINRADVSGNEYEAALAEIARLYQEGYTLDFSPVYQDQHYPRIPLPTYPFEREAYWIPDGAKAPALTGADFQAEAGPAIYRRLPSLHYYSTRWEPVAEDAAQAMEFPHTLRPCTVVIFDEGDFAARYLETMRELDRNAFSLRVIVVRSGESFRELDHDNYRFDLEDAANYETFFARLEAEGAFPDRLFFYGISTRQYEKTAKHDRNVFQLSALAKAIGRYLAGKQLYLFFAWKSTHASESPSCNALAGLARSVHQELPGLACKLLELRNVPEDQETKIIIHESQPEQMGEIEVCYEGTKKYVKTFHELKQDAAMTTGLPFKMKGVYLITGGLGGLGLIFAEYLVTHYQAGLLLTGRSALTEEKKEVLRKLSSCGSKVVYIEADIADRDQTEKLITQTKTHFPSINGIIHSAGVIRDSFIFKKNPDEIEAVLAPKIRGTDNLDIYTKDEPLDFFVLFSSLVALMGNTGQTDYAYANSYLDNFSSLRNRLVAQGIRYGHTISINWPLWQDGGMHVSPEEEELLVQYAGMTPLRSAEGIEALEHLLMSGAAQGVPVYGEKDRFETFIRKRFGNIITMPEKEQQSSVKMSGEGVAVTEGAIDQSHLLQATETYLTQVFEDLFKLSASKIDPHVRFEEYGINSIMITQFNARLEQALGSISKTILFECQTIHELARYLIARHAASLRSLLQIENETTGTPCDHQLKSDRPVFRRAEVSGPDTLADDAIAVIGMSGRYPQAEDLAAFWENLAAGKDCVTEVPRARWDADAYYNEQEPLKSDVYCKWGAFLENVDRFDPLFFQITPSQAGMIDPQERLFLETAWSVLEDAGYTRERLRASAREEGKPDVGVFVGVTSNTYEILGTERVLEMPVSKPWSIANRVSFLFDFQGPSMPIDTACSSSLTAIHLACESIKKGECCYAIAGGVNLYLHASKYRDLCKYDMLSRSGRCYSFGEQADGFVPGEGVGAVLLKSLHRAKQDGDRIYGIIKGSAINHGGRTNGFSVPSPHAQADVIQQALQNAGAEAGEIQYIEAHGTGTVLGDPVEITGLTRAFSRYTAETGFCSIGSVKSNIGHLESAAGISGLTKVMLQFQYKQLVPSLHASVLNPNIDLKTTPFYVQQSLTPWEAPCRIHHGKRETSPRMAGISSFGAGGANAHLVLEEYRENAYANVTTDANGPELFILSARNRERLKAYAEKMLKYLRNMLSDNLQHDNGPELLRQIVYTLQTGREPMEERLAFVVDDLRQLERLLAAYCNDQERGNGMYTGNVREMPGNTVPGNEETDVLDALIMQKKYYFLARLWVTGVKCNWEQLYRSATPRPVSLPTYPFARERYWLPEATRERDVDTATPSMAAATIETCYLQRQWEASHGSETRAATLEGNIAIIMNAGTKELAEEFSSQAGCTVTLIEDIAGRRFQAGEVFSLDLSRYEEGQALAHALVERHVTTIIDMSDLAPAGGASEAPAYGTIAMLQHLIEENRNEHLDLVHLTRGLQACTTGSTSLAGALQAGFVKMLGAEYAKVHAVTVDVDFLPDAKNAAQLQAILERELSIHEKESECCYRNSLRYVPRLQKIALEHLPHAFLDLDREKVYVVTGGTRGIGAEVARLLVRRGAKKLVLMGRNAFPERSEWQRLRADAAVDQMTREKIARVLELEAEGVAVSLYSGPLHHHHELERYFDGIRETMGAIGGVVHCAGLALHQDPAFIHKTPETIANVLEPKYDGLLTLHEIFRNDCLAFFVLFSSVSGVVPRLATGVSDYAAANAFLDYFSVYQHSRGNTYYRSIAWPSWQETGMGVVKSPVYQNIGFVPILTSEGLDFLEKAVLMCDIPAIVPCRIDLKTCDIDTLLYVTSSVPGSRGTSQQYAPTREQAGNGHHWLKTMFSEEFDIPLHVLDGATLFEAYGIDSILIAGLVRKIEAITGTVFEPSLLLEYPTLDQLIAYCDEHQIGTDTGRPGTVAIMAKEEKKSQPVTRALPQPLAVNQKIAVIGMSCNLPGAPDKETFWENLANGRSSITEVPHARWDSGILYSPKFEAGKSISKWGGFVTGIEYFDPDYFKIKEENAAKLDPFMRLFLETTEACLRDAGYEKESLAGRKIGVYVGSRISNYRERVAEVSADTITVGAQNFIAAHVAHYYDFSGPNLVVDSACSSSLLSIHLACQSIMLGESEMALAGGVDLLLDELPYLGLSIGALSPDGKCYTFDERANGFVPGEGSGAVLLKPFEKALADGDRIYAVIDASAVNNDGHTMGMTTPNPKAQAEVIADAIHKGGIDPRSIGYVEAHGTGTMIGDPIELKALTGVFRQFTADRNFCAVGSVKTNIGHALSAAGIASFIKTALCIHKRQLVPTLNCERPNPRFKFDESPFFINRETLPWEAYGGVLRAGISSFGFGGTNAHIIISECDPGLRDEHPVSRSALAPASFRKRRYWIEKKEQHNTGKDYFSEFGFEKGMPQPETHSDSGGNENPVVHFVRE